MSRGSHGDLSGHSTSEEDEDDNSEKVLYLCTSAGNDMHMIYVNIESDSRLPKLELGEILLSLQLTRIRRCDLLLKSPLPIALMVFNFRFILIFAEN